MRIHTSCSMNPVGAGGYDAELGGLDDIKFTLDKMQECLTKPILWYGDRFPEEYKIE